MSSPSTETPPLPAATPPPPPPPPSTSSGRPGTSSLFRTALSWAVALPRWALGCIRSTVLFPLHCLYALRRYLSPAGRTGGRPAIIADTTSGSGSSASGSGSGQEVQVEIDEPPKRSVAVIFDFDECLMRIHTWGAFQNTEISRVRLEERMVADPALLRWLFPALAAAGVTVAVATFGRRAVVLKAMRLLLGESQSIFTDANVSTPADHGILEGYASLGDKNTQLRALSEKLGVPLTDILFFDDSRTNVENARHLQASSAMAKPFNRAVWKEYGVPWLQARGIALPAAPELGLE